MTERPPLNKKSSSTRERVLVELSKGMSLSKSARMAGVAVSTIKLWIKNEETFAFLYQQALDAGTDRLEDEAMRRAVDGVERAVFYQDEPIDVRIEYSDSLLQFLLKARRPGIYRDNVNVEHSGRFGVEHSGPNGGPVPVRLFNTLEEVRAEMKRIGLPDREILALEDYTKRRVPPTLELVSNDDET